MIRDLVVKSRSFRGYDESRRVTRDELLELVEVPKNHLLYLQGEKTKYIFRYRISL